MPPLERRNLSLSSEQIDEIAEKAAIKAVEIMKSQFYQEAGKTALSKVLQIIGIFAIGLAFWAVRHNIIKAGDF
jgi:dipeptide/tripeptide permease